MALYSSFGIEMDRQLNRSFIIFQQNIVWKIDRFQKFYSLNQALSLYLLIVKIA